MFIIHNTIPYERYFLFTVVQRYFYYIIIIILFHILPDGR